MRVVGLVLALLALMVGIGSNLSAMVDPPSLIIVLGFTVGALLLGGDSLRLMARGIAAGSLSPAELPLAARGWKRARFYTLGAAAIGTLVGWVIMYTNLDDPAAIGPGMAIALLTTAYGMVLAFVLALPAQAAIEQRIPGAVDGSVTVTAVVATAWIVVCSLVTFAVLLLSVAEPAASTPATPMP